MTQSWGWNGKTNDGGTLTTGGTETWNASVSGSNLGTTAKARTKLGVRTVTVTCNGKSGTATKDVYQAENKITNVTQGAWVVSISANLVHLQKWEVHHKSLQVQGHQELTLGLQVQPMQLLMLLVLLHLVYLQLVQDSVYLVLL